MKSQALQELVKKIFGDEKTKSEFMSNPDSVLSQFALSEQEKKASITDEQVLELARIAMRIEEYYNKPQDTEWCLDEDGSIVILQSRTLNQIDVSKKQEDPDIEKTIDDAVIVRGGITAAPHITTAATAATATGVLWSR